MRVFQVQTTMLSHRKLSKVHNAICMQELILLIKTKRRMYQDQVTMICKTLRTLDTIEALLSLLVQVKDQILVVVKKANSNQVLGITIRIPT